ncbi:MAG: IclR family transcriptional regulator [Proteobacteria bacterium]|nr:IclR family transcriptional regulator [Pseudomonadota bacterium]
MTVQTALQDLPKATVPSVLKAARLLDQVAASRDALALGELSARLGLPKSSTLALCTSLTVCGLLKRYEDGTYHLGTRVVDLAHAYLVRTDVANEFAQALDALKVFDEEGAVLAVRDGTDVVYMACRNGNRPVGVSYRIGMRLPASCTATGKALISTLSDGEVRALYRGKHLPQLTTNSCTTVGALLDELRTVRQRGFATDNEETRDGMCCIGVPIGAPVDGPAIAAVAVSMIKGTDTEGKREQAVATLKALAQMLLHRLKMLR